MPTVPQPPLPSVGASALPQARASLPAMPDIAGQQAQQVGQALSGVGQQFAEAAMRMQAEANQSRLDAAISRGLALETDLTFGDAGYANLRGQDALMRDKPLHDDYRERYQKGLSEIDSTLGNDAQRRAFARWQSQRLQAFQSSVLQHAVREQKTFQMSEAVAGLAQRTDTIGRYYSDPTRIDEAVYGVAVQDADGLVIEKGIRQHAYDLAKLQGLSPAAAESAAKKAVSAGLRTAIGRALENGQIDTAQALQQKYANDMDADDLLAVERAITPELNAAQALSAVQRIMTSTASRIAPTDLDRAFSALQQTESGKRQFGADGKPLTSSAGAVGVSQIMPGTGPEAARLAGLEWDEQRFRQDASYNSALGRAYFAEQVRVFGGDLAKAYAAYNAGPGRTKAAIESAGPGGDWLAELPVETVEYVSKNMALFGSASTAPRPPTATELDEMLRNDPTIGSNPAAIKIARTELKARLDAAKKAQEEQGAQAKLAALRWLIDNDGLFASLPADLRFAIPPDQYTSVQADAAKIADEISKRGKITTHPRVWADILTMTDADLARMTPLAFESRYSATLSAEHMEKGLALVRAARKDTLDPKGLEIVTLAERTKRAAALAGIIPWSGQPTDNQAAAFAGFEAAVEKRLRFVEVAQGSKASVTQLDQVLAEVAKDQVFVEEWFKDPVKPYAALTAAERAAAYVTVDGQDVPLSAIPPAIADEIMANRMAAGERATWADVVADWVVLGKPIQ